MNNQSNKEMKLVFAAAIRHAINAVGMDSFRSTSMFGSNDVAKVEIKKAA